MRDTITPGQAAAFLAERDGFLILTHVRPDGDTVGCAAGLCRALRLAGKDAYVLENPGVTALFAPYLEGLTAPEGFTPETVVSVDVAARSMFPENAKVWQERVDLAIDHHDSQEFFGKRTCLDSGKADCGQIVYEVVRGFSEVTPEIAQALYVALSTDCGCFQYSNTDADAHRVAAELIACGFELYPVNRRHFRTKSLKRLKLEGLLTAGMELREDGQLALVFLTREMMEQLGLTEDDMEDISAFAGQIEGVRASVTLKETWDDHVKLSIRSDPGSLNANQVCGRLGGGGHAAAAGAMLSGPMEAARRAVLEAIAQTGGVSSPDGPSFS